MALEFNEYQDGFRFVIATCNLSFRKDGAINAILSTKVRNEKEYQGYISNPNKLIEKCFFYKKGKCEYVEGITPFHCECFQLR